mgnify:CR=1 FL=1
MSKFKRIKPVLESVMVHVQSNILLYWQLGEALAHSDYPTAVSYAKLLILRLLVGAAKTLWSYWKRKGTNDQKKN